MGKDTELYIVGLLWLILYYVADGWVQTLAGYIFPACMVAAAILWGLEFYIRHLEKKLKKLRGK